MAHRQPRSERRTQVDPFNAPDPVMPGDDVVVTGANSPLDHPRRKAATPVTRPNKTTASEDNLSSPKVKRASHAALRIVVVFFAIIVALSILNVVGSLVSSLFDWTSQEDSYLEDYDYDYDFDYDDDDYYYDESTLLAESAMEEEASERVEAELRAYVGTDEAAVAHASERVSNALVEWVGLGPDVLGIDATELARWAMENSSYEMPEAFAFAYSEPDGAGYRVEGDVFFYVTAPDLSLVIDGLASLRWDELDSAAERGSLTSGERALVSERLEALKSEALSETEERLLSASFEGSANEDGTVEDVTFSTSPLESLPL